MNQTEFYNKLIKQPVFLSYEFEDCVLRSEPKSGWFVKFKGEEEFLAKEESSIVSEAIRNPIEITEKEYLTY